MTRQNTTAIATRLAELVAELETLEADAKQVRLGGTVGNINMALSSLRASLNGSELRQPQRRVS